MSFLKLANEVETAAWFALQSTASVRIIILLCDLTDYYDEDKD